jgi:ornithine decarboxylase
MTQAESIEAFLKNKTTDLPVFCLYPEAARRAARSFVEGFPGEVLYAVKANPEARLLGWLHEGGIRSFDTASISEIELVRRTVPGAHCYYNHPIKPRASIVAAYRRLGVRDFVVDHSGELDKILQEVGADLTIEVRIAADSAHARVNFGSKFGALAQDAVALLKAVKASGATPAMCMHVGYQTTDPAAFVAGMRLACEIAQRAGVAIKYLNVGGGFPSVLMPKDLTLTDFFRKITAARAADPNLSGLSLKCEPGSALAHPSGGVLALVLSVKPGRVYLNDGIFGTMAELLHTRIQPPTRVLTPLAEARGGALEEFTVFGPTCDSYDTVPAKFLLPSGIREGDWIYLGMMGAYSTALTTDFNGLGAHETAVITGAAATA